MKKGFTLIELLAVIVILGLIAVITIPIVGRVLDNSKFNVALESALGYISAANAEASRNILNGQGINVTDQKYIFETDEDEEALSKIYVNGSLPSYAFLEFDPITLTVVQARICMNSYSIKYDDGASSRASIDYCHEYDKYAPIVTASLTRNIATINITDESSGADVYCINTTNSPRNCNWEKTNGINIERTFADLGTYYIFGRDKAGNTSSSYELIIDESCFCQYEAGDVFTFAYKGSQEEWTVPCDGIYKIDVWGAKGGDAYYRPWAECCGCIWNGSTGSATNGYSLSATYRLALDDTLKFVVGGNGGTGMNVDTCWDGTQAQTGGGGYNGGRGGVSGGSGSGGGTDVYLGDTKILGAHGGSGFLQGYGDYRQNEIGGGGSNYINSSIPNYVGTNAGASKNSTGGKVEVTFLGNE